MAIEASDMKAFFFQVFESNKPCRSWMYFSQAAATREQFCLPRPTTATLECSAIFETMEIMDTVAYWEEGLKVRYLYHGLAYRTR